MSVSLSFFPPMEFATWYRFTCTSLAVQPVLDLVQPIRSLLMITLTSNDRICTGYGYCSLTSKIWEMCTSPLRGQLTCELTCGVYLDKGTWLGWEMRTGKANSFLPHMLCAMRGFVWIASRQLNDWSLFSLGMDQLSSLCARRLSYTQSGCGEFKIVCHYNLLLLFWRREMWIGTFGLLIKTTTLLSELCSPGPDSIQCKSSD